MSFSGRPQQATFHANFVVIDQLGVLITGEANIGKSELTLGLLDRGHRFVCDDMVEVTQKNHQLIGRPPSLIKGYLLIDGIGLIDVPQLFGLGAVIDEHEIHLSISLVKPEHLPTREEDPLSPSCQTEFILGMPLPTIIFPISIASYLPLLIETLVRSRTHANIALKQ